MKFLRALAQPRRTAGIVLSLIVGLAFGSGALTPSAQAAAPSAVRNTCSLSSLDVPSCGVLWGMYAPKQNYAPFESAIGRQLDIVKNYVDWRADGGRFPNATAQNLAKAGRVLDFSWNPVNFETGAQISYASIAAGQWDNSVILPEAQVLKAFPSKVIIDFSHEFDTPAHASLGTPAQYVAAYQHIHNVMARAGVTNVIWAWVSTGYSAHDAQVAASYPGAAYVDWIGYDPYNWAQCHNTKWDTPLQTFQGFYNWVLTQPSMNSKPIMLGEYGSAPGGNVQSWYAGIPAALQQLPRIKAVMEWDGGSPAGCDFRLETSAGALAGFKTAANSAYILGQ